MIGAAACRLDTTRSVLHRAPFGWHIVRRSDECVMETSVRTFDARHAALTAGTRAVIAWESGAHGEGVPSAATVRPDGD